MKDFMKIESIGTLKIDRILFESYVPILFTCANEKNDTFLCVCCQANEKGKKWLITRTSPQIIINLLKDKITIRDAFLAFKDVQITVISNGDETQIIKQDEENWNPETSRSLPSKGEFMEAEEGEFEDEIRHYEQMLQNKLEKSPINDKYFFELPQIIEHSSLSMSAASEVEIGYEMDCYQNIPGRVYRMYEFNGEIDSERALKSDFETVNISDEIDYAA